MEDGERGRERDSIVEKRGWERSRGWEGEEQSEKFLGERSLRSDGHGGGVKPQWRSWMRGETVVDGGHGE